ncbi:MAG: ATP-binding protein [Acidobacteria bacterium]|nr:ATP-binding protein [Acidobacteriota bacterium]
MSLPRPTVNSSHASALRIAAVYAGLSALWIVFSDRLLAFLAKDPATLTMLQTFKGWFFVAATSLLLYMFIRRGLQRHEQSQLALLESESRFQGLVESAAYGIFRSTVDGRFLDVNESLVRMLSYDSRQELMARSLFEDLFAQPLDKSRVTDQILVAGSIKQTEVQWRNKDGAQIAVLLSARRSHHQQNESPVIEGIVEDVTERRALERRNQLLQKFEAIGQLAGGIAHDFNNVLGAVIGYAELALERSPQDPQLRKYLQIIGEQGNKGAGLTRQLLAFARRQILEPRNIDVNEVVSETLGLLRTAIGAHIGVRTVLAPDLAAARVDPTQLEQTLMNLCVNARDAMPQGGQLLVETRDIEIDEEYCRRYPYAHPGRYVLLTISDTGMGMAKATMDHIFEPFFTTKEPGKGTGLGLATVYGIVKQHGGLIHVYSEPRLGSVFRVYLPVGSGKAEAPKRASEEEVRGGTETVLVAEDHDAGREMAQQALEKFGYTVVVAADGEEAVKEFVARCDQIALVLLDVVMPKLTGPEAYRRICSVRPGVPVLFATGYSTESDLLRGVADRDYPIIQKPYTIDALARRVREFIDARNVGTARYAGRNHS